MIRTSRIFIKIRGVFYFKGIKLKYTDDTKVIKTVISKKDGHYQELVKYIVSIETIL